MIEQEIEDHLCTGVKQLGGEVRKAEWVARRHCPDRRVMHAKRCCWVECKKPGEKVRPGQAREHDRMRLLGEDVVVVSTIDEVEAFLETLK